MPNPNEYDDAGYLLASMGLRTAVSMLWEAGASKGDIDAEVCAAYESAEVED